MITSTIINIVLKYFRSITNSLTMPPIAIRSRLQVVSMAMEIERMEMVVAEQWFPSPHM
jgi:hypothetical protein